MSEGEAIAGGGPRITVVLPVRNEGPHIESVLADLLDQDVEPSALEVLVVDGRSTDDTRGRVEAVALRDARVRLLDNPRLLSSAARAIGAEAARGEFVAYVDGHCRIPSRSLVRDMLDLFERTGADCLARPQPLVASAEDAKALAISAARHSPFGHSLRSEIFGQTEGPVSPVSSGAAYRRTVFDRVGNFDPAFDACEDVEFNWRVEQAGCPTWTSPRLAVAYEPRSSYVTLYRQMFRYGLGRARLHRKHPRSFSVESVVPTLFGLGLPLLLAAPFLPSPWGFVVAAPYALYALLALSFGLRAARRRPGAGWLRTAVAFPVIHVGLGLGYLRGLVGPRPAPPVGADR